MIGTYNDNPSVNCDLERIQWRDQIIKQIVHASPPKVMGIHGTWGTGKTSLLAQMYTELGGDSAFKAQEKKPKRKFLEEFRTKFGKEADAFHPVWFEAWQYQHESNILLALLKEIRDQLTFAYKAKNRIMEDGMIAMAGLTQSVSFKFDAFGAKFGIKNVYKNFKNAQSDLQKERLSEPLDAIVQKKMLQEAIDQLLKIDLIIKDRPGKVKISKRKAVIFIDDLDRCQPDVAFRILESIKVYLNLENCIFVLGMDVRAVEQTLATYYGMQLIHEYNHENTPDQNQNNWKLRNLSRLYIEKICQDMYHIPVLTPQQKEKYFLQLLGAKISDYPELLIKLSKVVADFNILPPFPRSIKIYVNVLLFHLNNKDICSFILEEGTPDYQDRLNAFLIITYLYAFHFEIYQLSYLYEAFYNEEFLPYFNLILWIFGIIRHDQIS
ncbi:MAG: P-loop NTPase fold protein [Bacteroidota bacterium]